jgi:hypothetical protein
MTDKTIEEKYYFIPDNKEFDNNFIKKVIDNKKNNQVFQFYNCYYETYKQYHLFTQFFIDKEYRIVYVYNNKYELFLVCKNMDEVPMKIREKKLERII